ncbi:related to Cell cycle arrest protein BUB3 [Zygosaccharomyces bailii ISA1307]|nr:related to Cell cycle arrest protein BUB3 [Zygosaccharomyces bailii ISA1307]
MAVVHETIEVDKVASDYLSDVVILSELSQLAVTAWDGSLSIYDYSDKKVQLNTTLRHQFPLLCCVACGDRGEHIYCGGVQGEVLLANRASSKFQVVRNNTATLGVTSMCCYRNTVICGSWDGLLQVVDRESNEIVFKMQLNDKILSMDSNNERLVVATARNKVFWWSLPFGKDSSFGNEVESGLKFQTRRIKLTPQGDGYVSSSLDGRVAVQYFQDEQRKFAFRCHRMNLADTNFVFPVNGLAFLPNSTVLYTGGADGCVLCWNLATRKKVDQLPKFNENSVVQLACNNEILCVATSDDSFKTCAVVNEDTELQPSRLYVVFLN